MALSRVSLPLTQPSPSLAFPMLSRRELNFKSFELTHPHVLTRVGDLRFRMPQPPQNISGVQQAIKFGNSCPRQISLQPNATLPDTPLLEGAPQLIAELMPTSNITQSEDCRSLVDDLFQGIQSYIYRFVPECYSSC